MRRTRESDIKKIAALTQSSVKEQREIYHRCEEKSYILLDGYGNVYGTICGHETEKKFYTLKRYSWKNITEEMVLVVCFWN